LLTHCSITERIFKDDQNQDLILPYIITRYIFLSSTQPRCHNYSLWKHRQFTILWLSVSVICSRCYSNPIICTRLPHATDGRTVGHYIITQTLPRTMQAVSSITDAATTEPVLNNASKVLRVNACHKLTFPNLLKSLFYSCCCWY